MINRKLGQLTVSVLGLGCMGMSMAYGKADDNQSIKTILHAIACGITLFDTADLYGDGHNERLIGQALKNIDRDKVVIATKCGFVRQGNYQYVITGDPEYIKTACEASLQRLGIDVIDLYYLHRADPKVPIEDSVGALADLVTAGKVRHIGLSEIKLATLKRAVAVHPITALQTEYSLWQRKPEDEILQYCRELGIGFVPYSPLGRGFLSGKIQDVASLEENDFRRVAPKFQGENFTRNLKLLATFTEYARSKHCTPAQLALAWVLAQGDFIVPIPGTRVIERLDENIKAVDIHLTAAELQIDHLMPRDAIVGEQYPQHLNFEV